MTDMPFSDVLDKIHYKDGWMFLVECGDDGRYYLQCAFPAPCVIEGRPQRQKGRKWLLSEHMTRSEVVATAFKAIITAEEHEARECFLYKGERVFGPHIDVDDMAFALRIKEVRTSVRKEKP